VAGSEFVVLRNSCEIRRADSERIGARLLRLTREAETTMGRTRSDLARVHARE